MFEGLDDDSVREAGKEVEKETGVSFELVGKDGCLEITACGAGAHASTPQEGKNAATALLLLITRLPFAPCRQMEVIPLPDRADASRRHRGKSSGCCYG